MRCLYCDIIDIQPDAVAGLCVSCQWSARFRMVIPVDRGDGRGLCLVWASVSPDNPLGAESPDEGVEYRPDDLLPDGTPEELAALRSELFTLYYESEVFEQNRSMRARATLAEARAGGIAIELDTLFGCMRILNPRACTFDLLVRLHELQDWIADELTRERGEKIDRNNRDKEEFVTLVANAYHRSWSDAGKKTDVPSL